MGKMTYKRLKGSQSFSQLLLSTLSSTPILIEDIHADETWPGTKLKYKPGTIMGGRQHSAHDCGVSWSIGYFLEPRIMLCLFAKQPLTIRLKGITNDSKDPSVDTFKSTTLPILKRFGVPSEGLEIKVESHGLPPNGGSEVLLFVPVVQSLTFEYGMIKAARGIINPLVSYVHIFSDHRSGLEAGKYGISLVVETTSGCFIFIDTVVSQVRDNDTCGLADDARRDLMPPNDNGVGIASALLGEIAQSGV
ncbi:putative RNA 3'-terminal phosphate cyclase-like protein [Glycine soja]|uniref:Putative RNA 3'-terminal phosphate cyclase-like protein n=1 Tax=Glycine soja TaxID=3848 RepID=A0A445H7G6_GLYSO|nr:putative RNA 3'-terminal phosphate cyclase-like protein [Glycine soja]